MNDFLLIDNLEDSLAHELVEALKEAHSLDVATAYFSAAGYEHIVAEVQALLDRGGKVRFLLGLNVTPGAQLLLPLLRETQTEFGSQRVAVRFIAPSPQKQFHDEVYLAHGETGATVIIGSANVSRSGNSLNLNYREVLPNSSPKLRQLQQWFDIMFQNQGTEYKWQSIAQVFSLTPPKLAARPPTQAAWHDPNPVPQASAPGL